MDIGEKKLIECAMCTADGEMKLLDYHLIELPPGWQLWWDKSDRTTKVICNQCALEISRWDTSLYVATTDKATP